MISHILTAISFFTSIYFFYNGNFLLAVVLLLVSQARLSESSLKGAMGKFLQQKREANCNVNVQITIDVEKVIDQVCTSKLYEYLNGSKLIKNSDEVTWRSLIVDNYKKKYNREYPIETVGFNIRNNLVWKDRIIDFKDMIYHEIFIPYELNSGDPNSEHFHPGPKIDLGITIRIFVVNGFLKLQVGEYGKQFTPEILRDGSLGAYLRYKTLTSFPLMYFNSFCIPEAYLNFSFNASDFYKVFHFGDHNKKHKKLPSDWKELNSDLRCYNYLCNSCFEDEDTTTGEMKKFERLILDFLKKKEIWLEKESFKNLCGNQDDIPLSMRDSDIWYRNDLISVSVSDLNEIKEKGKNYHFVDYWEEVP